MINMKFLNQAPEKTGGEKLTSEARNQQQLLIGGVRMKLHDIRALPVLDEDTIMNR